MQGSAAAYGWRQAGVDTSICAFLLQGKCRHLPSCRKNYILGALGCLWARARASAARTFEFANPCSFKLIPKERWGGFVVFMFFPMEHKGGF